MSRSTWSDEKLFYRLLNNTTERTYWDNIRTIRKRPTKEVFNRSVALTHSIENKAKKIGIDVLAQLGNTPRIFYRESVTRFFELLETETNPEILQALLSAIGHNYEQLSKTQIDKLCSFGDTNNGLIKAGLVHALLMIDKPTAIDTLIKLSTDKSNYVREWATFGLGTISERNNSKIREALWARVKDRHQDTKYEAFVGLALRKEIRINEIIKQELMQGEYGSQLFEAIIAVDGKEFLPILRIHFKKNQGDKSINPTWLRELENCIDELENEVTN